MPDAQNCSCTSTWLAILTSEQLLNALADASYKLTADFGTWKKPWARLISFQRLTDDIVHPFADDGASIPVPFTSASVGFVGFVRRARLQDHQKMYGTSGNSFVAVVEFDRPCEPEQ